VLLLDAHYVDASVAEDWVGQVRVIIIESSSFLGADLLTQ
jgi:hypothetical protein